MIIRIVVVDPENDSELLVYQVPENSRQHQLLLCLFDKEGIEYATLSSPYRGKTSRCMCGHVFESRRLLQEHIRVATPLGGVHAPDPSPLLVF